LPGWLGYYL